MSSAAACVVAVAVGAVSVMLEIPEITGALVSVVAAGAVITGFTFLVGVYMVVVAVGFLSARPTS
jgi:hypothetical protein